MNSRVFTFLFLVFLGTQAKAYAIDRASFYDALSSSSLELLDERIQVISTAPDDSRKSAYLGALYMKKAAYLTGVQDKVATFKKGAELLEKEIENQPENAEYRFLRLTIQEHAPQILNYNDKIAEDLDMVYSRVDESDPVLLKAITSYCADSEVMDCSKIRSN